MKKYRDMVKDHEKDINQVMIKYEASKDQNELLKDKN
jgi:hypothetical protein